MQKTIYTKEFKDKIVEDFRKFGGYEDPPKVSIMEYAEAVNVNQATVRSWLFPDQELEKRQRRALRAKAKKNAAQRKQERIARVQESLQQTPSVVRPITTIPVVGSAYGSSQAHLSPVSQPSVYGYQPQGTQINAPAYQAVAVKNLRIVGTSVINGVTIYHCVE